MPPKGNHPVLGAWSWRVQNGNCVETYLFRADGTTLVTSGANVGESAYEISAEPSSMGFYRWNDRITKDNGKRDCSGQNIQVGHEEVNFIRFDPQGESLIVCEREALDACFGPLTRVHGQPL
jgi:hypothetical protein